ncbi:prophage LambdaBa04, prohead protease, putative [Sinorhizobium meliloti SM11]|uniref:Prophage LambdaBa04, prohead protease, putative n=1 Tax=Sinorhizobium meliloti (strain SM11) TaxID=707241 RepID=F7X7T4_SINMM|nr:HK97 family phage prohead protease [Sinorhizobium meliloti]AEH77524.1 prophage LambdaBa04, prohead protease, putative [Sinorhizobium meliloti SM11]MDE4559592.1 HK97 family phage prohead protease [Sinorhizobium meliloti SM11]
MAEISGYAIQWNQPAVIAGLFEERFARGAFNQSLLDHPDVAILWGHDATRPLGRVANKTLTLRSDNIGLWYSFSPNEQSPLGQEALATVAAGTVNEVSVGFASQIEEWDDSGDLPRRLITQARLFEISLVLWGAYGKATSAELVRAENKAAAIRRKAEAAMRKRGIPLT